MNDCPGHFGHIELCRPVYHCGFVADVAKILQCVCHGCSKLMVDDKDHKDRPALSKVDPESRLKAVYERAKSKKVCKLKAVSDLNKILEKVGMDEEKNPEELDEFGRPVAASNAGQTVESLGCGGVQPLYRREGMTIWMEYQGDVPNGGERKQPLTAFDARKILEKITDDDARKLGLNPKYCRPEWLLVKVLPVPPLHVRPEVHVEGQASASDDLSFALTSVVKLNNTLANAIKRAEPDHIIKEYTTLLQTHVTAIFDNARADTTQIKQRNGRPLKSIRQRLTGKEGRIRGNLMGKRVDFSARTVISADPNLSIDQVGVPKSVASTLTMPIPVTDFNIAELQSLVDKSVGKNPPEWPGAMYIIRADRTRIDLRYAPHQSVSLERGWIVERHLRDDDIVLFNRQPSLHKMSIMGHRAKVTPHRLYCLPYLSFFSRLSRFSCLILLSTVYTDLNC